MPTQQDLARARLSRDNFYIYCQAVHGVTLAEHMKEWTRLLESRDPAFRKVAIAAPPEFWKSRVLRMYIEWSIGRNVEWCRLLMMNTDAQATKQLKSIQDTIENNPMYKLTFPEVKPHRERGWNQHVMYIKRENSARPEPTLMVAGVGGAIQGSHFEEIYTDDITDPEDIYAEKTMEKQRQFVKGMLWDRFRRDEYEVPIGHWFAIFTRWGERDLWPTFTAPPDPNSPDGGLGFTGINMPAQRRDNEEYPWGGDLLWPEEYSHSRLEEIRTIKGSDLYTMTYLCDPSAMGGNIIPVDRVNRFDLLSPPDFDFKLHSWDIATGDSQDASYTTMQEWQRFGQGFALTHAYRARMRPSEKLSMIYRMRDDRFPNIVLIEDRGPGKEVIQEIEGYDTPDMPELRTTDPMGFGDKVARARAQQSVFENGMIWVPREAPWLADYLDELAAFPAGRFDDYVDGMSQALAYMRGEKLPRKRSGLPVSWANAVPAAAGPRLHRGIYAR